MDIVSIRGAITADNNTTADITSASVELFKEILEKNNLEINNIIHIIFSLTKDLNAIYPAKAIRENFQLNDTPLFCVQEADIHNSLEKCIRILVLTKSDKTKKEVKHIYLKGAQNLRPDLKG